jgi:SET domain-containing protein
VVKAPEKGGHAVQAIEPIAAGEVITVWGGRVVNAEQAAALEPGFREHNIQIEEGLYLAPIIADDASDYVNHSCDPNAGLAGQITLMAMRDIEPGEEITFDYAMADGDGYDQFPCACGSASCRHQVTGNDWKQPALWEKYKGYFSPYLQRRIDRLRATG